MRLLRKHQGSLTFVLEVKLKVKNLIPRKLYVLEKTP